MNKIKKEIERLLWNLESKTTSTGETTDHITGIVHAALARGFMLGFGIGAIIFIIMLEIAL